MLCSFLILMRFWAQISHIISQVANETFRNKAALELEYLLQRLVAILEAQMNDNFVLTH